MSDNGLSLSPMIPASLDWNIPSVSCEHPTLIFGIDSRRCSPVEEENVNVSETMAPLVTDPSP